MFSTIHIPWNVLSLNNTTPYNDRYQIQMPDASRWDGPETGQTWEVWGTDGIGYGPLAL